MYVNAIVVVHTPYYIICDSLKENCPFTTAHKVAMAKKLILDLKIIGQEMKSPFSLHFEQI